MKRILLVLMAFCAGLGGFSGLSRVANQTRMRSVLKAQEWVSSTNQLAEAQETVTELRRQVLEKKDLLQAATRRSKFTPELMTLLHDSAGSAHAWAELRGQLGLGWDASADYVLVSKRVIGELDYPVFLSAVRASDTACDLLALSPDEQSALRGLLKRTREAWQGLAVERTPPTGDIVAQYTVHPPDTAAEQSLRSSFAAGLVDVLGAERAESALPRAWAELRSSLGPETSETMTIRRSEIDGQPDLLCEMQRGNNSQSDPVRYGRYPSSWFFALFPGGWKTLAEREGFELPPNFQKH